MRSYRPCAKRIRRASRCALRDSRPVRERPQVDRAAFGSSRAIVTRHPGFARSHGFLVDGAIVLLRRTTVHEIRERERTGVLRRATSRPQIRRREYASDRREREAIGFGRAVDHRANRAIGRARRSGQPSRHAVAPLSAIRTPPGFLNLSSGVREPGSAAAAGPDRSASRASSPGSSTSTR